MNLQEMMNEITRLGAQQKTETEILTRMAAADSVDLKAMEAQQGTVDALNARIATLRKCYDAEKTAQADTLGQGVQEQKSEGGILKSREYRHAFLNAVRHGMSKKTARNYQGTQILYDALTEGGGDPVGSDGGFLVPEDIDNTIRELKRQYKPLSELFSVEQVTAPTGWRVMDTAPTAGMAKVDEMAAIADGAQPKFVKVPYVVDKYAEIIPVSNELMADNDAALEAYLARWFARKLVLTENALIIAALETLTGSALGAKGINGIKTVLNKVLDPALSAGAVIICNQDGFDFLDQLEDDHNRGLLQPDPTNATQYRILGRDVHMVSNAMMPGTSLYIGDGHEFGTLFVRKGLEVASTDIGGNAWKTDSTEIRGIARMGFSTFDKDAVARRTFGA